MRPSRRDLALFIRLIDEAPFRPDRWGSLVAEMGRCAPGAKIVIQAVDPRSGLALPTVTHGWTEQEMTDYAQHYSSVNVFLPPLLAGAALSVRHAENLITPRELEATEFYTDFLKPSGRVARGTGIKLFAGSNRLALLTTNYSEAASSHYDELFSDILRVIGPRIQAALHLARVTQTSTTLMTTKTLIDLIAGAAFVVDAELTLLTANEQGLAWLEGMGRRARSLTGLPFAADLSRAVSRTLRGPPGSAGADLLVRTDTGSDRLSCIRLTDTAHALPKLGPLLAADSSCLVVVRAQDDVTPDMAERYALTKAEARIARHLARGESLIQTADAIGISHETARTHLKSIFAKTDTKRQAELVLLLAKGGF